MHSEDQRLTTLLREAADAAAGAGFPDAAGRARHRLRVRRRIRLAAAAGIAAVAVASLSWQNSGVAGRRAPAANIAAPPATTTPSAPATPPPRIGTEGSMWPSPGGTFTGPSPTGTAGSSPRVFGCPPQAPRAPAPHGLVVTLELPKGQALSGEPVTMMLHVRNEGPGSISWPRTTTQSYDFWIRRGDRVVWRWSRGQVFAPAAQTTTVQPGAESRHAEVWDQSSCPEAGASFLQPAGRYVAQALVRTSEGGWWSNPVEFIIR